MITSNRAFVAEYRSSEKGKATTTTSVVGWANDGAPLVLNREANQLVRAEDYAIGWELADIYEVEVAYIPAPPGHEHDGCPVIGYRVQWSQWLDDEVERIYGLKDDE